MSCIYDFLYRLKNIIMLLKNMIFFTKIILLTKYNNVVKKYEIFY